MGEKRQNELSVNSKQDVDFHLPAEREKLSEGAKLTVSAVTELEAALQAGEPALISEKNAAVGELVENLLNAGANVKQCTDWLAEEFKTP